MVKSPPPVQSAPHRAGRVILGSNELVRGIDTSSHDRLTTDDIKRWLANEEIHEPLEYALPLGLHGAASDVDPAQLPVLTLARIELGRQLFFDKRLSGGNSLACGDCHHPLQQYTSFLGNHATLRDPAVVFNRILSTEQFWDGHAKSLIDQPLTPITRPDEMRSSPAEVVKKLHSIEGYRLQFERIFGKVDFESVCQALAAFECTLVTAPSAWDFDVTFRELSARSVETLSADEQELLVEAREGMERLPLPESARRGAQLFFSTRTGCSTCHSGPNFTDESYHPLGVEPFESDAGRYAITKRAADRGAFKTPTLRNVAETGPYMHNGRFHHLEDAVAWLVRGGEESHSVLQPLKLTTAEQQDLVAFLKSLSSPLPQPEQGKLPQ